jgi:polysaccharide deacetylase 2 family uncharacterized protein YibQ
MGYYPSFECLIKNAPLMCTAPPMTPQILTKPLVVIVMADFGLSSKGSQDLLEKLPAAVTLSVPPAAPNTKILAQSAFNHGHELWTQAVTEPMDYPSSDPGHHALLTASSIEKNEKSLFNQMATLPGAVGFLATTPSPYFKSAADADFVAGAMFKRGLALMINSDQVASILSSEARKQGAAFYSGSMITLVPGENTDTFLQAVERRAVDDGYGIVICPANRVLQERVLSWASGLKTKGIEIAPLSVIAERGLTLMGAP